MNHTREYWLLVRKTKMTFQSMKYSHEPSEEGAMHILRLSYCILQTAMELTCWAELCPGRCYPMRRVFCNTFQQNSLLLWVNPETSQGFLEREPWHGNFNRRFVRLQKPWLGVLPLMLGLWLWLKPCPFSQKPLSTHTRSSGVYMSLGDREHWEPSGPDSPSPLHLDNSTGINLEMCITAQSSL